MSPHFGLPAGRCLAVALAIAAVLPPLLVGPLSDRGALAATLGAVGCYALWLHWFVARHGLGVSPLRGAALVLLVVALVRVIDIWLWTWLTYVVLGGLFSALGLLLWRKRRAPGAG